MMPKRYGTSFGCLDLFLLFVFLGSVWFLFAGGASSNLLVGILFWIVVGGVGFAWRRGWIQQYMDAQKAQERAVEVAQVRQQVEAKQLSEPVEAADDLLKPTDNEYPVFRVTTPRTDKLSPIQASGLVRALLSKVNNASLELSLVGTTSGVEWQVYHLGEGAFLTPEELSELFNTYYPGSVVTYATMQEPAQPLYRRYHIFSRNAARYFDRALSVNEIGREDPLAHLSQALIELGKDETFKFTIAVTGFKAAGEKELEEALTIPADKAGYHYQMGGISTYNAEALVGSLIGAGVVTFIRNMGLKKKRVWLYSEAETKHYLEKLSQPLANCAISITMDSPNKDRLNSLERVYGAVEQLSGDELGITEGYTSPDIPIRHFPDWFFKIPSAYISDMASSGKADESVAQLLFFLTVDELAALWHLPHSGFSKEVLGYTGVHAPIPRNLNMGQGGVRIGTNRNGPKATDVYLPPTDRTAHTTVIGKTNRGKSALLPTMVHQDIADGRGVCVIDPKGALVSDILQHSIPPEREADVLILDVSNKVNGKFIPPPFNLFVTGLDDDQTEGAAQRLVSLLNLSERDFAEKKMAATLKMALMAVYGVERPTIHDVHCLLFDEAYRARLIPTIKSSVVANFWSKFDSKTIGAQASLTEPLEWRLERFILNNRLRAMTCHPLRLNFGKLMGSNKIILISLGDERDTIDQEERYFLGAAILSRIDYAARQKTITKPPFMVYVDEAQEFVDTSLPRMLSQLRSFGVGLVLANQYFHQMFGDTFKAIEGNVSTLMAFEIGSDDAATMLPYLQPTITKTDLLNLGKYTAAVSMLDADGKRQDAFTVETLPPPGHGTKNPEREEYLRAKCVEVWGLPGYDEVLNAIDTRYADCAGQTPEPGEGVIHTQGSGYEGFE